MHCITDLKLCQDCAHITCFIWTTRKYKCNNLIVMIRNKYLYKIVRPLREHKILKHPRKKLQIVTQFYVKTQ